MATTEWSQTSGMTSADADDNLVTYAEQAEASATAAANSASNAATSASDAANSATTAQGHASTAATQASNASTSATAASNSATAAAGSAAAAATSEANAATSETNAATSATNAATSASSAASSATSASGSATTAAAEASNAATSATNAASSATASASSATNASASETAAATSETNAATSATNAATSATNAASSATAAQTSETNAAISSASSAASAVDANTSAVSAATSETNAAASATAAANSEVDAESARDQSQAARDAANLHKLAAEAAATSATNTASALTGFDLEAIAASKGVTAVDVFVYDTSRDSDGGAWRKRTQHTSWYNETLNTANRGSRREFPAVAVIVAEADKVTIYDGDDPALPMWSRWLQANTTDGSTGWFRGGYAATSVAAKNGLVVFGVGQNGLSPDGLCYIDLNKDIVGRYGDTTGFGGFGFDASSGGKTPELPFRNTVQIVDARVNDVAMTVLPDAPIDPATGLPVPTIAVATAGGLSLITDNGTVWDYGFNEAAAAKDVSAVSINGDYITLVNSQGTTVVFRADALTSDQQFFSGIPRQSYFAASTPALLVTSGSAVRVVGLPVGFARNGSLGLSFAEADRSDQAKSMVAYTTSTYNTGWMNGDIKGAFLADTDDTDLVGSGELVTNGTFDTDVSGWTTGATSTFTWNASGYADLDRNLGSAYEVNQNFTTVVGQRYLATADVVALSNGAGINVAGIEVSRTTTGKLFLTFTATSTTTTIYLGATQSTTATASFDNISVQLADADRSVNNKGLIVNGTVTRTPVATGADLVAYSGFSASNYLEQPYNSDLDFGTGDFCVMGWVKGLDPSPAGPIVERGSSPTRSGSHWILERRPSSYKFSLTDDGFVTRDDVDAGSCSALDFVCGVVRSGVAELWVNARLVASKTIVNATLGQTNTGAVLIVGSYATLSAFFPDDLALLRISATAPTVEQIKKIYEDEKFLFQENAQATLYGTSDAVTALAHDEVTDLLHVGTSAGRSVFQGLRRVSNTTTAVGTAISASNNLIVEE